MVDDVSNVKIKLSPGKIPFFSYNSIESFNKADANERQIILDSTQAILDEYINLDDSFRLNAIITLRQNVIKIIENDVNLIRHPLVFKYCLEIVKQLGNESTE